jgi:repressor LexA
MYVMRESGEKRKRGRRPVEGLTAAQGKAFKAIRSFAEKKGFPPTVKELADQLGMASASAHELVSELVRKNFLHRTPRKARSLEIVKQPPVPASDLVSVPIVCSVAAGMPILAVENIEGEVLVDAHTVRGTCFALEVKGDSMIEADIAEGDYVIVHQQPLAESGDIVVALMEDEVTVKRLFISDEKIELRPENPAYPVVPIGEKNNLRILGKAVAIRRKPKWKNRI